ncbi:response regulator transcription factor [Actinomadura soli]|uniref:Response regulator transcription factor n=2 Tax=Actinomadura soli TaxID=2508997 RepID=A0A5C4IZK8_9ACTN|nr:response regulator transcription factor [Actinomadura soli]
MKSDFSMSSETAVESESKAVRVVVVSDNPVSRIGFRALLGTAPGVDVVGGGPVERSVAGVRAHRPDVVLLDASPPPPDGIARLARSGVRVVAVTAEQEPLMLVQAVAAGAHGCLVYGHFEPRGLADVLVAAGRGESSLSRPVVTALVRWVHDGGGPRPDPGLTAREAEILELIAAGLTNREIARRLVITEKTVKNHAHQIYKRLGADGREHAVARWLELNSVPNGTNLR